jgi:predicted nucleic acid-binding protein
VLFNVFVPQPRTPIARAVGREDLDWRAPVLWRSELRHALVRLCRRGLFEWSEATRVMGVLQAKLRNREYRVESRAVFRFARESGCSAYDAEYAVLAELLDVPLVTWDQSLLRALPGRALTPEAFVTSK